MKNFTTILGASIGYIKQLLPGMVSDNVKRQIDEVLYDAVVEEVNKIPKPKDGVKGDKGDKGNIGPKGDKGKDGINGLNGKDGKDGIDGKEGKQGKVGPQGPEGSKGDRGPEGKQGPKGSRGEKGQSGDDGSIINSWRGDFIPGTQYLRGDLVHSDGTTWLAMQDTLQRPPGDGVVWDIFAAKGKRGLRGTGGGGGDASAAGNLEIQFTAEVAIDRLKLVAVNQNTGKVVLADNTDIDSQNSVVGLSLNSASANGSVTVLNQGTITDSSFTFDASGNLILFLGTSGDITQTAPSAPTNAYLLRVGHVVSPSEILIDIKQPIALFV